MRKTLFLISAVFMLNCTRNEETKSLSSKEENRMIAKFYGISSIKENQKIPISVLKNNRDLSDIGYEFLVNKADNRIIYAVPFKQDNKKFLLLDEKGKELIMDINVDEKGNGDVTIIYEDNKIVKNFQNAHLMNVDHFEKIENFSASTSFKGIETEENWKFIAKGKKSKFRECFDEAYDDVCDDFWGCAAWYTNPTVPLLAMIKCAF